MLRVFLSYSHADEQLRRKLETHLAMLKRSGEIDVWHDRELVVGDHLDGEISQYLESADLIIFLVSADFLASYYCYEREMTRAMERVAASTARVAPIVVRACDWKSAPFAQYVLSPTDAKPVVEHADIDAAFLTIVNELRRAIDKISSKRPASGVHPGFNPTLFADDTVAAPRSSNLRVRKDFTDADQARFLDEAFEFIFKFFRNTVEELSNRNPHIEGRVKRLSEERFSVDLFKNGQSLSSASIFISRSFGAPMIAYSSGRGHSDNSMNGGFHVGHDEQMQFLQPWMFMFARGREEDAKLSFHGAAEMLWEQIIAPLQS
jgi:hypothetical protein